MSYDLTSLRCPDMSRFLALEAKLREDQAHGMLRLRGVGLAYWCMYAPASDLRAWVMEEIEARLHAHGYWYTSAGWVPAGKLDGRPAHITGLHIAGTVGTEEGDEVDRLVVAAEGDPVPGRPGDHWRLFNPDETLEVDRDALAAILPFRPRPVD